MHKNQIFNQIIEKKKTQKCFLYGFSLPVAGQLHDMSFGSSSRRLMQNSLESPRLNSRVWLTWDSRVNFSRSPMLSHSLSPFSLSQLAASTVLTYWPFCHVWCTWFFASFLFPLRRHWNCNQTNFGSPTVFNIVIIFFLIY
jgi:hypothetical protein